MLDSGRYRERCTGPSVPIGLSTWWVQLAPVENMVGGALLMKGLCKTAVTRSAVSAQNASQTLWRPGSARTRGGAYSAPTDSLAGVNVSRVRPLKGRGRRERKIMGRQKVESREVRHDFESTSTFGI